MSQYGIPFASVAVVIAFTVNAFANQQKDKLLDTRDGTEYKTVSIGNQIWMAENLNYNAEHSYCYHLADSNCVKYGRFYTWEAAQKACPTDWHLPNKKEFEVLLQTVGAASGKMLKTKGGWKENGNGSDLFDFSAIPVGYSISDRFSGLGYGTFFWTASGDDNDIAYSMYLAHNNSSATLRSGYKWYLFSVRCIHNNAEENLPDEKKRDIGIFEDTRDGKNYKKVKIGQQTWMAENLNYSHTGSYCYENKVANCTKYGRLYTWSSAQRACPSGWHLPTESEFASLMKTIADSVGDTTVVGVALKSSSEWDERNGTDDFSFSALPAGRWNYGQYIPMGKLASFWSSTDAYDGTVSCINLTYDYNQPILDYVEKDFRLSVRCVQDQVKEKSKEFFFMDYRDGKKYKMVAIGNQIWMAENLAYKMPDSYCYQYEDANCIKYGRFYTGASAQKACPYGWHLPSKDDFEQLFETVGGKSTAGNMLKSATGWIRAYNANRDKVSGNGNGLWDFSASPVGRFYGGFDGMGESAYFWSSSENGTFVYAMGLYNSSSDAELELNNKYNYRYSVRCLKNDSIIEPEKQKSDNKPENILIDLRDGQEYKTVKIGKQTWMAQNLNYETEYSYCYNNKESNCSKYGRLYKVNVAYEACPIGWHLPSEDDFKTLVKAAGGRKSAGKKLKSKSGWKKGGNGTDAFGFSAFPVGRAYYEKFYEEGAAASFWSSTCCEMDMAYYLGLWSNRNEASVDYIGEDYALSIRCVKDD